VIGIPAIALAILFLATGKDIDDQCKPPKWMLALVIIGTIVAFLLALNTVWKNFMPDVETSVALEEDFNSCVSSTDVGQ